MQNELAGKWPDILRILGVDRRLLTGKHGPCPKCGGKDRYRFTDFKGKGNWICEPCGGGDGYDLLKITLGYGFAEAKKRIEEINGEIKPVSPKKPVNHKGRCQWLWKQSTAIQAGDMADRYLTGRGLTLRPRSLRFLVDCPYSRTEACPAMIARVTSPTKEFVTLHRTFLSEIGKANLPDVRKLMPGTMQDGCCVWLSDVAEVLGIAEGVETALAATQLFDMPVWAAINAGMMEKWIPPIEAKEIIIYADHDENHRGQKAAYTLASRLSTTHKVSVKIPENQGEDWADVWLRINAIDEKIKQT